MHGIGKKCREFREAAPGFLGSPNTLVIRIRDIADIIKLIAADTQPARNDIEADQHAGMAKMAEIVYCHAAHIHAHTLWFDGFEGLFFASQGVINVQHAPGCDQRVKSWAVSITSACLARPAGTVFFRHPFYGSY